MPRHLQPTAIDEQRGAFGHAKLVYRCGKQRSEPTSDKRGAKVDELHLTPLELIDRMHQTRRSGLR